MSYYLSPPLQPFMEWQNMRYSQELFFGRVHPDNLIDQFSYAGFCASGRNDGGMFCDLVLTGLESAFDFSLIYGFADINQNGYVVAINLNFRPIKR